MIEVREKSQIHGLGHAPENLIVKVIESAAFEDGKRPYAADHDLEKLAKAVVATVGRELWNEETVFIPKPIVVVDAEMMLAWDFWYASKADRVKIAKRMKP